ncbi:hypothetical protein JKP88DRAFT_265343 [Tribonema minus]|uniref:RING-type domain-containing protein n=1 Tax=Tribonema minus TaxID=303371 RepID=A0A835YL62_9STRA|nr:hypothetical protein JKP88DRAFT_265343 [Tribonema minus]
MHSLLYQRLKLALLDPRISDALHTCQHLVAGQAVNAVNALTTRCNRKHTQRRTSARCYPAFEDLMSAHAEATVAAIQGYRAAICSIIDQELIQNADDAGAREVKFCLDTRQHGTATLPAQQLAQFQGPALLAFNSGVFTDMDFESIQRIGDSLKKAAFLPHVNPSNPGKTLRFRQHAATIAEYADQFAPLRVFDNNFNSRFEGTLFRFPLRTAEQAAASRLSRTVHTVDGTRELLRQFVAESVGMLLFLKNVERLVVCEWVEGESEPRCLHECYIDNVSNALQCARSLALSAASSGSATSAPTKCDYFLDIVSQSRSTLPAPPPARQRWLVCNQLGGKRANAIAADPRHELMRFVPWAGVAARVKEDAGAAAVRRGRAYCFLPLPVFTGLPVHVNGYFELSSNRRDIWTGDDMAGDGAVRAQWNAALVEEIAASCYARLLLGVRTELGDRAAYDTLWPPLPSAGSVTSAVGAPAGVWAGCVAVFVALVRAQPVLQTAHEKGHWVTPRDAVVLGGALDDAPDAERCRLKALLLGEGVPLVDCARAIQRGLAHAGARGAAGGGGVWCPEASPKWVRGLLRERGLKGAAVLQGEAAKARSDVLFLLRYCLGDLAKQGEFADMAGVPLVPLADGSYGCFQTVGALHKDHAALRAMGFTEGQCLRAFTHCDTLQDAVNWLMADDNAEAAAVAAPQRASTSVAAGAEPYLLASGEEVALLTGAGSRLISEAALSESAAGGRGSGNGGGAAAARGAEGHALLRRVFRSAAFQATLNVASLRADFLPDLVALSLPRAWREGGEGAVSWPWTPAQGGHPGADWFRALWRYFARRCPDAVGAFAESWPVVPTNEGRVCRLSLRSAVVSADGLDAGVRALLRRAGALTLLAGLFDAEAGGGAAVTPPPLLFDYVRRGDRAGLLATLGSALRSAASARDYTALLSTAEPSERDALRAALCRQPPTEMSREERAVAAALPLWPVHRVSDALQPAASAPAAGASVAAAAPAAAAATEYKAAGAPLYMVLETGGGPVALSAGGKAEGEGDEEVLSVLRLVGKDEHLFTAIFARLNSDSDVTEIGLARHLGIRPLSRAAFYKEHVLRLLPQLPPTLKAAATVSLLRELSHLSQQDSGFLAHAMNMDLVVTKGRSMVNAKTLFDPSASELLPLMPDDKFPSGAYLLPDVLASLRMLGLQTALDWQGLVSVAKSIEELHATACYACADGANATTAVIVHLSSPRSPSHHPPAARLSAAQDPEAAAKRGRKLIEYMDKHVADLWPKKQKGGAAYSVFTAEFNERRLQALAQLMAHKWVPVHVALPSPLLPPHRSQPTHPPGGRGPARPPPSRVASPSAVRPSADMWFCSASFWVLDGAVRTKELSPGIVAEQLARMAEHFEAIAPSLAAPAAAPAEASAAAAGSGSAAVAVPDTTEKGIEAAQQMLAGIVPRLYQFLSDALEVRHTPADIIRNPLHAAPWLWVGAGGFVPADRVAFSAPANAAPYLYSVPSDFACFGVLLRELGVREAFGPGDFCFVLRTMAIETHALIEEPERVADAPHLAPAAAQGAGGLLQALRGAVAGNWSPSPQPAQRKSAEPVRKTPRPLSPAQVDLAVAMVQVLSDESFRAADWEIFSPDASGILAASTELVYDDCPWLTKGGGAEGGHGPVLRSVPKDVRYVHPKVRGTGDESGIEYSLDFGIKSEAFGQQESLTRRLRHILEMYPEGPSILSELIQNADDAGARTVKIMYSTKQYGTSSLLGPKMDCWQGGAGALYFYNDAAFSDRDFHSLARIGQASKLDKVATTGRFGLGFNAVYHFTDLPSFVTGDFCVMFDPHTAYVPGATSQQPGIKVRFTDSDLLAQFEDQFSPYLHFGCDFKKRFPGTLFRFPLRTKAVARDSEISHTCYGPHEVKELLDGFKETAHRFLLFLRSVQRIEVYVLGDEDEAPRCVDPKYFNLNLLRRDSSAVVWMEVRSVAAQSGCIPRLQHHVEIAHRSNQQWDAIPRFIKEATGGSNSKEAFYSRLAHTPEGQLPRTLQTVTINFKHAPQLRAGAAAPLAITAEAGDTPATAPSATPSTAATPSAISTTAVTSSTAVVPSAGAALALTAPEGPANEDIEDVFMVCVQLGAGRARAFACDPQQRDLKFLPWGGVAAHLTRNGKPIERTRGKAFCFLPLPVDAGLPVHVNGYFELSSNRRDIWFGEDLAGEGRRRSEWNRLLLEDVIVPAYALLLDAATKNLGPGAQYLSLLPAEASPPKPWDIVVEALYKRLRKASVLYTEALNGKWVPLESAVVIGAAAAEGGADNALAVAAQAAQAEQLHKVLVEEGVPVVKVPDGLKKTLLYHGCVAAEGNSAFVRSYFKERRYNTCLEGGNALHNAQFLLDFAHKDLAPDRLGELIGLPLLPLTNGTLCRLEPPTSEPRLLPSALERKLFADAAGQWLVADLATLTRPVVTLLKDEHFHEVRKCYRATNVAVMQPQHAVRLMKEVLPQAWFQLSQVAWAPSAGDARPKQPSEAWMQQLWEYMCMMSSDGDDNDGAVTADQSEAARQRLHLFEGGWPLLPAHGGAGADALRVLLQLRGGGCMAVVSPVRPGGRYASTLNLNSEVKEALGRLGVWVLDVEGLGKKTAANPLVLDYARALRIVLRRHCTCACHSYQWPPHSCSLCFLNMLSILLAADQLNCTNPGAMTHMPTCWARCGVLNMARCALRLMAIPPNAQYAHKSPLRSCSLYSRRCTAEGVLSALLVALYGADAAAAALNTDKTLAAATPSASVAPPPGLQPALITNRFRGMAPPAREALREFLRKGEGQLKPALKWLLRALPLYPLHGSSEGCYAALDGGRERHLPPANVDAALLDDSFVKVYDTEDLELCQYLGVSRMKPAAFHLRYILPCIACGALTGILRDAAVLSILKDFNSLKAAEPELEALMRSTPLIPPATTPFPSTDAGTSTSSSTAALLRPDELYNPEVAELRKLLAASAFPRADFCAPAALTTLAQLGLRSSLSAAGVLDSARSIADAFSAGAVTAAAVPHAPQRGSGTGAARGAAGGYGGASGGVGSAAAVIGGGAAAAAEPADGVAAQQRSAMQRAQDLLRFLDMHLERMLRDLAERGEGEGEGDAQQQAAAARWYLEGAADAVEAELQDVHSDPGDGTDDARAAVAAAPRPRFDFVDSLTAIAWLPVLATAPWPYLPWREATSPTVAASAAANAPQLTVAAPCSARPPEDAWLCSCALAVVKDSATSAVLKRVLGWDAPVPPGILARQLVALSERHADALRRTPTQAAQMGQQLQAPVSQMYMLLNKAVGTPEMSAAVPVLASAPWMWLGDRFVYARRVALKCPSDAAPFLHPVPAALRSFGALLRACGVRETFGAADYADVLEDIYSAYQRRARAQAAAALDEEQFELAVKVAKLLAELPSRERQTISGRIVYLPSTTGAMFPAQSLVYNDAQWLKATLQASACPNNQNAIKFVHGHVAPKSAAVLGVRSLRDYLFMDSGKSQDEPCPKLGALRSRLRSRTAAEAARSRQATDGAALSGARAEGMQEAVPCGAAPDQCCAAAHADSAATRCGERLRHKLAQPSAHAHYDPPHTHCNPNVASHTCARCAAAAGKYDAAWLCELLEVAESAGATGVRILLDARDQPDESLLHPALAAAQRAAFVIVLEGAVLGTEPLMALLRWRTNAQWAWAGGFPAFGPGLLSLFHVADCLQVFSGGAYHVFDPCGQYIFNGEAPAQADEAAGDSPAPGDAPGSSAQAGAASAERPPQQGQDNAKAKRYSISRNDVFERFPHQFAPFLAVPGANIEAGLRSPEGRFHGTALRLSLRTAVGAGAVLPRTWQFQAARDCLEKGFLPSARAAFGFGSSLQHITAHVWEKNRDQPELSFAVSAEGGGNGRRVRADLAVWREWAVKKMPLNFLQRPIAPRKHVYQLSVKHYILLGCASKHRPMPLSCLPMPHYCTPTVHRRTSLNGSIEPRWIVPNNNVHAHVPRQVQLGPRLQANSGDSATTTEHWLVASVMAPPALRDPAQDYFSELSRAAPLLSCAALLSIEGAGGQRGAGGAGLSCGRLFVRHDTTVRTGLPFHVDGPFFVTDRGRGGLKRRALVLSPHDDPALSDLRCQEWNTRLFQSLCSEAVPYFMEQLAATLRVGGAAQLYRNWPLVSRLRQPFQNLVPAELHQKLAVAPLYLSTSGSLVRMSEGLLKTRPLSPAIEAFLGRQFALLSVPSLVTRDFLARYNAQQRTSATAPMLRELTPAGVRSMLRAPPSARALAAEAQLESSRGGGGGRGGGASVVVQLLAYCLSDALPPVAGETADEDANAAAARRKATWEQLLGLCLLPLASGAVGAFSRNGQYLLATPSQAAAQLAAWFECPDFLSAVGIVKLTPRRLAAMACEMLPQEWKGKKFVQWRTDVTTEYLDETTQHEEAGGGAAPAAPAAVAGPQPFVGGPVSQEWVAAFWREVPMSDAALVAALHEWPLVPITTGELASCSLAPSIFRACPGAIHADTQRRLDAAAAATAAAAARVLELRSTATDVLSAGGPAAAAAAAAVAREETLPPDSDTEAEEEEGGPEEGSEAAAAAAAAESGAAAAAGAAAAGAGASGSAAAAAAAAGVGAASPAATAVQAMQAAQAMMAAAINNPDVAAAAAAHAASVAMASAFNVAQVAMAAGPAAAAAAAAEALAGGNGTAAAAAPPAAPAPADAASLTSPRLRQLRQLLHELGAPVLDFSFVPCETRNAVATAGGVTGPDAAARMALHGLHSLRSERTPPYPLPLRTPTAADAADDAAATQPQGAAARQQGRLRWSILSEADTEALLLALCRPGGEAGGLAVTPSDQQKLKELPVWRTMAGSSVCLSRPGANRAFFALERNAAEGENVAGGLPLPPSAQSMLLAHSPVLDDIYRDMQIERISMGDTLARMVLPELMRMTPADRDAVLQYVLEHWSQLSANAELKEKLGKVPFVTVSGDRRVLPEKLLDPRNAVMASIFDDAPDMFPQGAFAQPAWLDVLADLGLHKSFNRDTFLLCAKKLETQSHLDPLPLPVATKARRLVAELNGDAGVQFLGGHTFVDELSRVRFVPVQAPVNARAGVGGGGFVTRLMRFEDAAAPRDAHLCYTVLPVLADGAAPPQMFWSRLRVVSPPPLESVLAHLHNIAQPNALDQWDYKDPPSKVFRSLYAFIEEEWPKLTDYAKKELQAAPLVPVRGRMVKASRLFFRLRGEDLAPYLYEVPRAFGAFDRLFRQLGTTMTPTAQDYVTLLQELRAECGRQALNPNEVGAVLKVLRLLAAEVETSGPQALHEATSTGSLYVVDDTSRLVPRLATLYNDAQWLRGRINRARVSLVHPKVTMETCKALGIACASAMIHEQLELGFNPEPFAGDPTSADAFDKDPIAAAAALTATLNSQEFAAAVVTLRRSLAPGGGAGGSSGAADPMDAMMARLGGVTVMLVKVLRTRFLRSGANGGEEDVTAPDGAEGSLFFVDAPGRRLLVGLQAKELRENGRRMRIWDYGITPAHVVALAVCQLLQLPTSAAAPLAAVLSVPANRAATALSLLRLGEDEVLTRELRRGTPGTPLLACDAELVELKPLKTFSHDEIVAVEDEAGLLRYAVVVDEDDDGGDGAAAAASAAGAAAAAVPLVASVRLRTRPGPQTVVLLSTDIYCFSHTRDPSGSSSNAEYHRQQRQKQQEAKRGPAKPLPRWAVELPAAAAAATQGGAADVLPPPPPPVSREQVLTVVESILARCDLTLADGERRWVQEATALRKETAQARAAATAAELRAQEAETAAAEANDAWKCRICYENDIAKVLHPCGHTVCTTCLATVNGQCPYCRARFSAHTAIHRN